MRNSTDILMLDGVVVFCADCAEDCVFVPMGDSGEFCCTACDAAVFLLGTGAGSLVVGEVDGADARSGFAA